MNKVVDRVVALVACEAHPGNYVRHGKKQLAGLRESLRIFGQVRGIVVQARGTGFVIAAGHGVVEAARAEGLTELRASVIPADWPAAQVEAYLVADNELARRSDPDEDQLAALLRGVKSVDETLAAVALGGVEELREFLDRMEASELRETKPNERKLGDAKRQIKAVLYTDEVGVFERALRLAELPNRGEALLMICREFIERHGRAAEGQFDVIAESDLAATLVG